MKSFNLTEDQSIFDTVTQINGSGVSVGTIADLVSSDSRFCWVQWGCCDAIPCADNTITSITATNAGGSYNPTSTALVGGRPSRPVAK